jgi:hypothetical protein
LASWIARTSFCVMRSGRAAVPAACSRIGVRAVVRLDARIACRELAVDRAVLQDHAGEVQLGDHSMMPNRRCR